LRASASDTSGESLPMEGFAVDPDAVPDDATDGPIETELAEQLENGKKDIES
jgi:hypothetical protein